MGMDREWTAGMDRGLRKLNTTAGGTILCLGMVACRDKDSSECLWMGRANLLNENKQINEIKFTIYFTRELNSNVNSKMFYYTTPKFNPCSFFNAELIVI